MRSLVSTLVAVSLVAGCGSGTSAGTAEARSGRLLMPEVVAFGVVPLGSGLERALTLRNDGRGPLAIEAIELPAPFAGGAGIPATLAVGESLEVPIVFEPRAPGPVEAVAVVRADGADHEVRITATGGEYPLRCTPATVDLGRPVVGAVRSFRIECVNEGDREFPVEVDGPAGFTWVPTGVVGLPAGEATTFDLQYRPTGVGPIAATIRLAAGSVTVAEVAVTANNLATAVGPIAGVGCPGGLDFGFTPPGTTATRSFAVRNLGDEPLRVTSATVEGPFTLAPAAPFEVPADDPATAGDEGTLEVTVTFAPSAPGTATGTLQLAFDDPGMPRVTGCLTGFGGGPAIACAPAAIDFGLVASGAPRTLQVTCANLGTDVPGTSEDRLRFTSIVAQGAGFSADASWPAEGLGPGESIAIDVTFAPVATGIAPGTLVVESNDPVLPRLGVPLAGDGLLAGPCDYRVEPAALSFGRVAAGGTPADLAVSIRNVGSEPCVVGEVALDPASSSSFALRDGPLDAVVIEAGERLDVPVRFTPGGTGSSSGSMSASISAPSRPRVDVALSGAVAPAEPCVRLYPESVDFGEVGPGCASLVAELMLVNTCPTAATLTAVDWAGPADAFRVPTATAGLVLQPGVPTPLAIEYRPAVAGEHLAGLRVRTAAEGESRLVPVRGVATTPSGVETFPPLPSAIDVLFVMDNGAAAEAQAVAGAGVSTFLEAATTWAQDWQFGVTTTGLHGPCGNPGGAGGAEDGRLFPVDGGRPRIVRASTPNYPAVAAANLAVGNCQFEEQPLEAALRAVTPPLVDHADDPRHPETNDGNLGFLRRGARLAVVALLDEDDQSPGACAVYAAGMGAAKREFWRDHRFVGHVITGDRTTGCSSPSGNATAGDKLIAWSEATGGRFTSICASDWRFDQLGQAVFGRYRFPLKGRPAGTIVPSSADLRILVDGQPWAGPATGWRWDETRNEVVFDLAWAPEPTSAVEIRYTPRCVAPGN